MLYSITKYFVFCGHLSVNINVKDSFLRSEFPLKAMKIVVYVYRLGELRLYKNSMMNYFKPNDYKLSQNLQSLFIYF